LASGLTAFVVLVWEDFESTVEVPVGGTFCGQARDTASVHRAISDASWRSDGVIGSFKLRPSTLTVSPQTSLRKICVPYGARTCVRRAAHRGSGGPSLAPRGREVVVESL
jgi:hypothetical protein